MNSTIQVSVRELHARTGHYVRKAAARQRVVVTDNGRAIAELMPLGQITQTPFFSRRPLRPGFKKLQGKLGPRAGDRDITDLISDDRD